MQVIWAVIWSVFLSLAVPEKPVYSGWATHYANGVMEWQVEYHTAVSKRIPPRVENISGFVAVEDCARIGQFAFIRHESEKTYQRYLIVDCAGRNAYDEHGVSWMSRDNVLAEVDYQTCERWKTCGRGARIEVIFTHATAWDEYTKEKQSSEQLERLKVSKQRIYEEVSWADGRPVGERGGHNRPNAGRGHRIGPGGNPGRDGIASR